MLIGLSKRGDIKKFTLTITLSHIHKFTEPNPNDSEEICLFQPFTLGAIYTFFFTFNNNYPISLSFIWKT